MKVRVNGVQLYFDVDGAQLAVGEGGPIERPTLIVLHGAPGISDHMAFKPDFVALTDVAQVVYLDLRGAGRSDDDPGSRYSLERFADDVVGFCEALGNEKPIVLGNSAGGMVAAMLGIRHPDHPGKLILSSTQARLNVVRCARCSNDSAARSHAKQPSVALIERLLTTARRRNEKTFDRPLVHQRPPFDETGEGAVDGERDAIVPALDRYVGQSQ